MEDKIEKIFSYFGNIKNEPFYTSCISQIIEIYQTNPESLKYILYNLNQLIFSNCKEVRLRLKHRLICSSIISKLNKIYVQRVKEFVQNKLNFELESFQLDDCPNKIEEKSKNDRWEELDLIKVIETQELLFASNKGKGEANLNQSQQDEKKVFDSFLDMNHATMLNIQNAFKDVQTMNEVTDEAFKVQKSKYKQKLEKISQKSKEQMAMVELTISNPFNLMYQICINNLLHSQWELRHLSVLVLKELLLHSEFLGFNSKFVLRKEDSPERRFEFISNLTKDLLRNHISDTQKKRQLIDEIATSCIRLLALDRFADYQTDESVILVRMIGAQILTICFKTLEPGQQLQMIKMIRRVFQKQTPFSSNKSKLTWQVKHSFLYFLTIVIKNDKSYGKLLCAQLEQSLIKMLTNDQIDQITLCICTIIESFLGEPFFTTQKIDRTNRQIWGIVENLDDISISARDTLRLLLKLFPYFKLNEGNCIDRLKKFFTSKISEVRIQLYKLIGCLYSKKKDIPDGKLIQRNLVQLLQAVIIQHQTENFKAVIEVMPHIIPYIVKTKNIRKIVQFINTCVTPHQYTEEIITGKFLMPQDKQKNEYTSNQYLYIYEHENVHCPVSVYTDKRSWKMSLALKQMFRNSSEGLEELLRGVQKNNQKNYRAKLLIYNFVILLLPQYKKLKAFEEYKQQTSKIVNIEFSDIIDNQINKLLLPQMQKQLRLISQNAKYKQNETCKQGMQSVTEIYQSFKKNSFNLKNGVQIAKKFSALYNQNLDPIFLGDIQIILRFMNNIVKIQRELCKNIKILAVRYLIQYHQPNQVQGLNIVIKSIMQAIKQDAYIFISEAAAHSAMGLSLSLMKNKKLVYTKFNNNLCYHVSTSYQISEINMTERENSLKMQSQYMKGICMYIELIGKASPDYLKDTWKYYLAQNMEAKQGKVPEIQEEYNRLLILLTGTVTTLLKIDNKSIDEQGFFINKLINKLSVIISKSQSPLRDSIFIKIKRILSDVFIYLSQNYSEISNIFFEWFIKQMQAEKIIFFEVLQKICSQQIVKIASVASLFILQIVKSISIVHLHDSAMNSLSNIIVGVYTNIIKNRFSPYLNKISQEGIQFIKNFKNTSNFDYKIDVQFYPGIVLRSYQIEGIIWLGFLTKYNLNGALCDDMGLGKTIQTLTVIQNEYLKSTKDPLKKAQEGYLHSLIVCPTTLMQHWAFQYKKYFPKAICQVIILDNKKKIGQITSKQNADYPCLFITSYSMIERNDNLFEKVSLKFTILDEGHIIKNTRTNKFKAVKRLKSLHRFILTGTPIQNRLIELWGLFDFLMPGYLYAEDIFKRNYERLFEVNLTTFKEDELLFSEEQRKTLEKLHFKVMPFIMRRMKGDVLRQLPEKIINDYYCSLSLCQMKHYQNLEEKIKRQNQLKQINPLANLHEMIKIVNHPYLGDLQSQCNWQDSGKFIALGELFEQFGFTDEDSLQHNKVIIFAKEKNSIDLIERYLKQNYKGLNYLKLTSDIREGDRFTVAQTFNGDIDIKILLVTKAIGGVGLNLSSANCVIMFDSDYNPTVDMQAIDRAHRIGQKRVLNVYRLITKDTLQQKIMGIQKFKTNLANAIVNIDNASIKNVQESKLPDLLQNVRDLQKTSKQTEAKIDKMMYGAIVSQMEKNAIETNEFLQRY